MTKDIKFTIIPNGTKSAKEISVPQKWLYFTAVTAILLGAAGFYFLFSGILWEKTEDADFRRNLARENFEVTQKILEIKRTSSNLESRISELQDEKAKTLSLSWNQGPERKKNISKNLWYNPNKSVPAEINIDSIQIQVIKLSSFFDTILSLIKESREKIIFLPIAWPVAESSFIIRGFGQAIDPFSARKAFHAGVDFAGIPGDPVYAAGNGIVQSLENSPFYGKMIRIRHLENVETVYAHLNSYQVQIGKKVNRGDKIGTIGKTGMATGPRLHFEVVVDGEKIDPESIFLAESPQLENFAYGSR